MTPRLRHLSLGALSAQALFFSGSAYAQTDIPIEMTINAPHRVIVSSGRDSGFSYDGTTLTPATDTIIFCIDTTNLDLTLDIQTENGSEGDYNALRAPNLSSHISYSATGTFAPLASRTLLNGFSDTFDLSAVTPGLGGCDASNFAFALELAPLTTPTANGVTLDEAIDAENIVGTGERIFSDVIDRKRVV